MPTDKRIDQLPNDTTPPGSAEIPINNSGVTEKVSITNLMAPIQTAYQTADTVLQQQISILQTNQASLVSPHFTGIPTSPTAAPGTNTTQIATTAFVIAAEALDLHLTGGTMSGAINMGGVNKITSLQDPTLIQDAATKNYVDGVATLKAGVLQNYDVSITSAAPLLWLTFAITTGNRFYMTNAGTFAAGAGVVQVGDIMEARINNPTDATADWAVIQGNCVQATTAVIGITATASDAQALAKASIVNAVTPSNFAAMASTTSFAGLAALATQAQVNAGTSATTIVTPATLAGSLLANGTFHVSVTIPTASVLLLNGTPYQIVATPGAGVAIQVISAFAQIKTYGTTPYATNTTLGLIADTATSASNYQAVNSSLLARTAATIKQFQQAGVGATDNNAQLIANKALMAYVYAGNPTAGDSDIVIDVQYRLITL